MKSSYLGDLTLRYIDKESALLLQPDTPRGGAKLSSIFELVSKKNHQLYMDQYESLGLK
jgi:hypothetical protein